MKNLLKIRNFKIWLVSGSLIILSIIFISVFKHLKSNTSLKLSPTPVTNQYLYQSKSKGFAVYLGNRRDQNSPQVKFSSAKASIDFKPLNIQAGSMIIKDEKSIIYQEVLPGVDISYSLTTKGVKEEIIIKTETAREKIMADGQLLFEATVDKALLQKEENNNGAINFTDLEGKKPLFNIPQPFMFDAQGKRSEQIKIEFLPESTINQNKFTVKLIPDQNWLKKAKLPITIDPTVEISILNVYSHPQTGDNWEVSFNTQGTADLTITPTDQASIDDLDFISLTCNGQIKNPQILENDVIFYPNWSCNGTGQIVHFVNLGGKHHLQFQFGEQIAYAHNSPGTEILRPNADGDVIELYNNDLTQVNNWSYVDDEVPTGSVLNYGGNGYDLYNLPAHSGSGTINKITVWAKIMTGGSPDYARIAIKTGGTVYYSGNLTTAAYETEDKSYEWAINPQTGLAWAWDDIDTLQIGIELMSVAVDFVSCSQLYVEVDYTNNPPTAPTDLLCEGETNPTTVIDTTPEFSAVYLDPDEGDIANKYQIQVDDNSDFSSVFWDSGSSGTPMTNCNKDARCEDITYAGSTLAGATTYYWRIKYWDQVGNEGEWSNTALLNTSLDFQPADESGFSQEDLAYNATVTPSATTGIINLTLSSGSWNTNSKVKAGAKVVGNGGIATIREEPTTSSTIQAEVDDDFNDTSGITSGNWQLYATEFSSLEELVLNDFKDKKNFNTDSSGSSVGSYISATKIADNKVLIAYQDSGVFNYGNAVVASVSGTTISYGSEATFNAARTYYISTVQLDTDKALIAYEEGSAPYYGNAIVASVSGTTISYGSEANFYANSTYYISTAQLGTDKALIAYRDNSNYGSAIVASVSGTTISYGSEATFNAASTAYVSAAQLDTDKAIIAYEKDASSGNAIVASVSGTTISYGSEATFNAARTYYISTVQLDTDKMIIAYREGNSPYFGNAIVASVSGTTISYGSEATFNAASTSYVTTAQLTTDKAIIAYQDSTGYGNAIVASVSGTTISYGSEATFNAASTYYISTVQLDTDKALIAYDYGNAIVASVSGTTISYGSEATFNAGAQTNYISATKITDNKVLIAYQDDSDSNYGNAIVASVSGTTISYGSEATFNSARTEYISVAQLDTDKAIIAYRDSNAYGNAIVASVSGTTISYGSEATFNSANTWITSIAQLTTDKAIIAYEDYGASDYGNAIVASVSGTTISYGSEATFNAASTSYVTTAQLTTDKAIIAYHDTSPVYGNAIVASVSGTTISYGSETTFNSAGTYYIAAAQLDTDKAIIAFQDSNGGNAIVASVSGTTISYGSEATFNAASTSYVTTAQLTTDKAIIAYQDYSGSYFGSAIVASVSGTTISYGSETTFNRGPITYSGVAQLDTDKALIAYDGMDMPDTTQTLGSAVAVDVSGTTFTSFYGETNYATDNYYVTSTSDSNQIDVSTWSDINSGTVTETLNGETINYAISFDDRTTWKIYDTTGGDAGWRPIARDNSGTWEYNSNTTAGATDITWTSASANTQFGALDQAFQVTANQMTGTEFNAITDSQWEETGGFDSSSTTVLDFAFGLKTTDETVTPELDQITMDYDNEHDYFILNFAPTAPTSLLTEESTNPSNVIDTTPEFSAIYNDGVGDIANKYQIQVDDDPAFGSTLWDSGAAGTAMSDCTAGDRCQDISYSGAGTDLQWNTKYYWRIKYWDDTPLEGAWSTEEAYFTMSPIYEPTSCMIDDSGQSDELIVKWADNTSLETAYRIERSVDAGVWTLLSTEVADTVSKTDNTVSSDHTYLYRLRAESDNGNSQWCATSQVDYSEGTYQMQGINAQGITIR